MSFISRRISKVIFCCSILCDLTNTWECILHFQLHYFVYIPPTPPIDFCTLIGPSCTFLHGSPYPSKHLVPTEPPNPLIIVFFFVYYSIGLFSLHCFPNIGKTSQLTPASRLCQYLLSPLHFNSLWENCHKFPLTQWVAGRVHSGHTFSLGDLAFTESTKL